MPKKPNTYRDRVLRQIAAKIIYELPPSDSDSRKVLKYARQMLDGFIAQPKRKATA